MSWWTHCTKTGRVVYDRRIHKFRWTDVLRIIKALPDPDPYQKSMGAFLSVLIHVLRQTTYIPEMYSFGNPEPDEPTIPQLAEAIIHLLRRGDTEDPNFGGGEFAGGGATRDFDSDGSGSGPYGPTDPDRPEDAPPPWLVPFYFPPEEE